MNDLEEMADTAADGDTPKTFEEWAKSYKPPAAQGIKKPDNAMTIMFRDAWNASQRAMRVRAIEACEEVLSEFAARNLASQSDFSIEPTSNNYREVGAKRCADAIKALEAE